MTEPEKKGVLIAEDHTLIREGLRALISSHSDLEVVGEAGDGREAVWLAEKSSPALVLMDLSMPRMGGVEAIRVIKKSRPKIKILALTVNDSEEYGQASIASSMHLTEPTSDRMISAFSFISSIRKTSGYNSAHVSHPIHTASSK